MKRTIYLKVEFDENVWNDYDDVSDELIIEDSGVLNVLKIGVDVEIVSETEINNKKQNKLTVIGTAFKEYNCYLNMSEETAIEKLLYL